MKKIILLAIALVFISIPAFAADVKLAWDPVTGAASYKIYMSTDQGVTWTSGINVGNVTTYTYTGVSDTVQVLFKASAIGPNGAESVGHWYGVFWDSRKKPLDVPYGLGVK